MVTLGQDNDGLSEYSACTKGSIVMRKLDHTVSNVPGVHAMSANQLVNTAQQFKSSIIITSGMTMANMKSLFSVVTLGIKKGDKISITVNGSDEDTAVDALKEYLNENI